jgi:hypothetical protein
VVSIQTLSESDRRLLAAWASSCAERVLPLFEAPTAEDRQVHDALARARAFGAGESTAAVEIRLRLVAFTAAGAATDPAGAAAARSVAQAAAVAHMGAHALGAAAYAVKAVTLAPAHGPEARDEELRWQLGRLTAEQRRALRRLPAVGTDTSGPLGPGLLSRGVLGDVIREIQAAVAG